ncbi:YesL family protein [Sutcliffiella horikoshii]|uniref:YesL family protein n=1 Tax=Sutcliffiella horikoshii TaxID=79883 RepID=UPI001CFCA840|nr:DUF624 domain-containing protein [Sutcliffiella horikoshii]
MMQTVTDNGLYRIMDWLVKLVYLNLLWIFFTSIGAVIFGWIPATKVMHLIMKRWLVEQETFKVFPYFWIEFKKEWKSNITASLFFLVLGIVLWMDVKFFFASYSAIHTLGKFLTIQLIAGALILIVNYVTTSYPEDWSLFQKLRNSLIQGLKTPFKTLVAILTSLLMIVLLLILHPGLVVLLGASLLAINHVTLSRVLKKNDGLYRERTMS